MGSLINGKTKDVGFGVWASGSWEYKNKHKYKFMAGSVWGMEFGFEGVSGLHLSGRMWFINTSWGLSGDMGVIHKDADEGLQGADPCS